MPRNLSQDERIKILFLHDQGRNISQISKELNVARATVRRWVQREGGERSVKDRPRPHPPRVISAERMEQMLAVYGQAPYAPIKQFAEEFDCTPQAIRNALKRAGVQYRRPANKREKIKAKKKKFARGFGFRTKMDGSKPRLVADLIKMEPEAKRSRNPDMVIKQQLPDQNTVEEAVHELYVDHEVKEELVVGPTLLQRSPPVMLLEWTCADIKVESDEDKHIEESVVDTNERSCCTRGVMQDDCDLHLETNFINKVEPEIGSSAAHDAVKLEIINEDTFEVTSSAVCELGPTELQPSVPVVPLHQLCADIKVESDEEEAVEDMSEDWCTRGVTQDDRDLHLETDMINKVEPETGRSAAHDAVKLEIFNQDTFGATASVVCELYTGHEVKEELVLGPIELQCSVPVVSLQEICAGVREQSVFTQHAETRDRSENEMCCDVESWAWAHRQCER